MTQPQRGSKLTRAALILLLALAGAGLFLVLRPAPPSPAPVVLLQDGFPKYAPTLFERYVPSKPGWGWAWKMREFVMGRPKAITVAVSVLECPELPGNGVPDLPLGKASYADTNGVQVWFLGDPDLNGVTERIRQMPGSRMISRPRVSTSSGVECSMQADKSFLGLLGYTYADRTDLYARFRQADDSLNTTIGSGRAYDESSLGKGLRLQVPHGSGVLLLNTDPKTGKRIAVALSLAFPQNKK